MQLKDIRKLFFGLNKDVDPSLLQQGEMTDALNVRVASSDAQHGIGPAETMQSEIEILIDVSAPVYYYGAAIGGDFIYTGYEEVQIGNQVWMKRNWDYNYPGSKVFNNDEANRAVYGGLYKWNDTRQADFCPSGWHMPSEAEIDQLLTYLGGELIAGGSLKEPDDLHWKLPNTGADDLSGFKGLGGGRYSAAFDLLKEMGLFWLSDESEKPQLKDIDGNIYTTIKTNTQEWIVQYLKTTKYADGTAINNIIINGYDDWFLPSLDTIVEMYTNLHVFGVGGFALGQYWTSSEDNATRAYWKSFSDGSFGIALKTSLYYVRACRSFMAGIGAYALRDIGPAGGLIFYIDGAGTTYYEAAPTDQSTGKIWSNITAVAVTGTGIMFGTGQANTTAIISQAGHTDSAAKACDDLEAGGGWPDCLDGAYCWYNNDEATYKDIYGGLYNWYAVHDSRGLAYFEREGLREHGWRVAVQNDWLALINYLGGDAVAGGKLKEVGIAHWQNPNVGATNEIGFTALPTGDRTHGTGVFAWFPNFAFVWANTQFDDDQAYYIWFSNMLASAGLLGNGFKRSGFAVRCVRDL